MSGGYWTYGIYTSSADADIISSATPTAAEIDALNRNRLPAAIVIASGGLDIGTTCVRHYAFRPYVQPQPPTEDELDSRAIKEARRLVRVLPTTEDPDEFSADAMFDFFENDMPRILAMLDAKDKP